MKLIVTVDTEEEGLWSGDFPRKPEPVRNVEGIPRFQQVCDRYGVAPTYLINAAIVGTDRAVEILRPILDDNRCEIGAHVHPWCNPPLEEPNDAFHSYLNNLPRPLQARKIEWLTSSIEKRFGIRPTSFRGGRYGANGETIRILADLGYIVDSSVTPFLDHSSDGGPNHESAPWWPYRVGAENITMPVDSGLLWELPVSVGYTLSNFSFAHRMRRTALRSPWRQLRAVGILDRLGLARRVKFCPEQVGSSDLCKLARAFVANDAPAMVMMLHSSSLTVGTSPYARNETQLERLIDTLTEVLKHCTESLAMKPATLTEYAKELATGSV